MHFSENEFRDFLYDEHRQSFSSLIIGKREPIVWSDEGFPPLAFLLQQKAEKKINKIINNIEELTLSAKELRLDKEGDSTTRIDLLGNSEMSGLTIIELKKSKQTERQAFTELLAYANHFCSIFPGLKESSLTSILVAPMETRTVRDAYVQELVANQKNVLALIPEEIKGKIFLNVFYPDESYYHWFENNLLDDRSMLTVVLSFSIIDGWIDTDFNTGQSNIPEYSKNALNTISNSISHKLESLGIHSLVYASQQWGEIAQVFPFPNTIVIAAINPFASFRTGIYEEEICGESKDGRLEELQSIYDQLHESEKAYWLELFEARFYNDLIRTVREEFEFCFKNTENEYIQKEISIPDWYGFKTSMIESVFVHHVDIYLTGLLREIYADYIEYIYSTGIDEIYYYDDLPKYSYKTLRSFFAVWEILRGLGVGQEIDDVQ
ncbi:MAG: hypothetical protein AB7S65_05025 [Sulfuricurvum sp.]